MWESCLPGNLDDTIWKTRGESESVPTPTHNLSYRAAPPLRDHLTTTRNPHDPQTAVSASAACNHGGLGL